MRVLKIVVLVSCLATLHSTAAAEDDAPTIKGEWRVVSLERNGQVDHQIGMREMRFVFEDETWQVWAGDPLKKGATVKYRTDHTKAPKQVDTFHLKRPDYIAKKAIYRIHDGKLYICHGPKDGKRPTTFDTTNTDNYCYVAERISFEDGEDQEPTGQN